MLRIRALPTLLAMLAFANGAAASAPCTAESGPRRVALLELFTSEGCDSCPPTDRWMSALPGRGLSRDRVVALGFHVDYWNYLGWNDPYARAEYSARQRAAAQRNKAKVIYTPQLILNGADYRPGRGKEDIADRVTAINRSSPAASIRLKLSTMAGGSLAVAGIASIPDSAQRGSARAYLALYENNLATEVRSGENRGKRLRHDYVVRSLAGPFPLDGRGEAILDHRFPLAPLWNTAEMHLAAFVQNESTGDVLQALSLPYCR